MRVLIYLLLFNAFSISALAQDLRFKWAGSIGGINNEINTQFAVDSDGNMYLVGDFTGSVDLNPGPEIETHTTANYTESFLLKLNPLGELVWIRKWSSDYGAVRIPRLIISNTNDIILNGYYDDFRTDLDPGSGYFFPSNSSEKSFLIKLNSQGQFITAVTTNKFVNEKWQISNAGNIFIQDDNENFITYDNQLNFISSSEKAGAQDFDFGINNTFCTTARYRDFMNPGTDNFGISRSSAAGSWSFDNSSRTYSSNYQQIADKILALDNGNMSVIYHVEGPNINVSRHEGLPSNIQGGFDNYRNWLVTYNSEGTVIWKKEIQRNPTIPLNTSNFSSHLATDENSNIYLFGYAENAVSFDSKGIYPSGGGGFLYKISPEGDVINRFEIDGDMSESIQTLIVQNGNIYLSGIFNGSVILDPVNNSQVNTSAGGFDAFISVLQDCQTTIDTLNVSACDAYISPSGKTWDKPGYYFDTLTSSIGCDSTFFIFVDIAHSTVNNLEIEACGSYKSPTGKLWTNTGMYSDTLKNNNNCDSIININLTITSFKEYVDQISACEIYTWDLSGKSYEQSILDTVYYTGSNGCDSLSILDLTIHHVDSVKDSIHTCDYYHWDANGAVYTKPGVYTATTSNVHGCDSIIELTLTFGSSSATNITSIEVCESYYWSITNETYSESGTYTKQYTNVSGCDSNYQLNLTIRPTSLTNIVHHACADTYTWSANNQTYSQAGEYTAILSSQYGCDSIVTLDLTFGQEIPVMHDTIEACYFYEWPFFPETYFESGIYEATYTSSTGCDSTGFLHLTIHNADEQFDTVFTCESSYVWEVNGQTYTEGGYYFERFANMHGCDSNRGLTLAFGNESFSEQNEESCGSYYWPINGQTYNQTGTYLEVFNNAEGCDSTIYLNLSIVHVNTNVSISGDTSAIAESVASTYQWLDCNNGMSPIDGAIAQVYTPEQNGSYAVEITYNNCIDTSDCVLMEKVGQTELNKEFVVRLFPNPTKGMILLEADNKEAVKVSYQVYDILGNKIMSEELNPEKTNIAINLNPVSNGLYFLSLQLDDKIKTFKIIKE